MYIQRISRKTKQKTYTSTVLAESYRENGKMKRRIISTLTNWPEWLIQELQKILRGGTVQKLEDMDFQQGKSFGAIYVLNEISKRIGFTKALGNDKHGKLALFQIFARLITQGSRLYAAQEWAKQEAIEEVLGLNSFSEDQLYSNLDWLADHQQNIEKRLFKHEHTDKIKTIYLYDVTSSYFEGSQNELAAYGHNRDGKKGKLQIVIGLLCDDQGDPISVEVFEGNTADMKTVSNQLLKLKDDFGVEKVAFVGDKGMIKTTQVDQIKELEWHYITSLTKSQIRSMLNQRIIQLSLFEDELTEVELDNERYILRRNPYRVKEIRKNRKEKIEYIHEKVKQKNIYLKEHPKAKVETAINKLNEIIKRLKLSKCLSITNEGDQLNLLVSEEQLKDLEQLDGCYVIKTDVSKKDADKETIHDRYKDLAKVELAFRTFKTGLEEIRPVYVRKEKRTRGHVFVCMLAYKLMHHIWKYFKEDQLFTQKYILESLDKIQFIEYQFKGQTIKQLPKNINDDQAVILKKLDICLPKSA